MPIRKKVSVSKGVVVEEAPVVEPAQVDEKVEVKPDFDYEAERRLQNEQRKKDRAGARQPDVILNTRTGKPLPRFEDVDPKKINQAVHTTKGWVIPHPDR